MPRNQSGVFALMPGNPVIPDTIIDSGNWANPTLSDIAQALSDSLDRSGRGGMNAPFKVADGTLAAPGLAFASESSSGLYREASKVMGIAINGVNVAKFEPGKVSLTTPLVEIADDLHVTGDATIDGLTTFPNKLPQCDVIPTLFNELTNKAYVDTYIDGKFSGAAGGGYLPLAGGKLTGALTIEANQYAQLILTNPDAAANQKIAKIYKATNGVLSFVTTNDAGSAEQTGFRINTDGTLVDVKTGGKFWHGANDGAGSGLDADLLDGYNAAVGLSPNTVVVRDGSNQIQAALLYGGAGNAGTLYNQGGGSTCFRWDGTNLFYRVNEAIDRLISTTATFAWSQADPGYLQVGPIIIQWGSTSCNIDSSVIVNLAKSWSYCVNSQATTNINANQTGTSVVSANVLWVSATQIAVGIGDQSWSGSVPVRWIAIGW